MSDLNGSPLWNSSTSMVAFPSIPKSWNIQSTVGLATIGRSFWVHLDGSPWESPLGLSLLKRMAGNGQEGGAGTVSPGDNEA